MKRITCIIAALLALVPAINSVAKDLCIIADGKSDYSIVVDAGAGQSEIYAASELSRWLKEVTGTIIPVTDRASGRSIYVGLSGNYREAGIPDLAEESCGIFVRGKDLYLCGGRNRSVIYSVYEFLKKAGCIWAAPDYYFYEGRQKSIPHLSELRWAKGDIVNGKALKYRKFYVEEGLSHNTDNLLQLIDWMPKAGYNTIVVPIDYEGRGTVKWDNWRNALTPELKKRDIIIEVGGHGYQNFMNADMEGGKLFEMHPEWFGMDNDGKRTEERRWVLCTSNPDAVAYLQNNVLAYLKAHPEIDIFDFWPPDGDRWCTCEKCKKTSPTDRHLALVSNTAEFLKKKLPEVKLECLAYSRYVAPPENERLDKEVLLDFCPIGQNFETQIYDETTAANKNYKQSLLKWKEVFEGEISVYSYYRKYIWQSLPNIIPHYMQKDLLFYQEHGCDGISIYSEPGDWFTYGPTHYVLGVLAANPQADVEVAMREYAETVFGEYADLALAVYDMLENTVAFATRFPSSLMKSMEFYPKEAEKVAHCRNDVEDIMRMASDPVLKRHLERLSLMLRYVEISIGERMNEVKTGKKLSGNMITDEVRALFTEQKGKGIFIIRK